MPAFPRRARLTLLGLATAACLLLLLPWMTYAGQSPHAWDVTVPWLAGSVLAAAALVLLVLPVRPAVHADLLAVVAACLAAALGGAGLLHVHVIGDCPSYRYRAVTAPAATAFFTASSEFVVRRDVVRADEGSALTGAAWAGLGVQLLLAGGSLVALRSATKG